MSERVEVKAEGSLASRVPSSSPKIMATFHCGDSKDGGDLLLKRNRCART